MNAAYAYDTHKASSQIASRIYYLLELKHWSVKTLSDESNIPYETLKKLLSHKTENTSFHNIAKIALAFKCNLNELTEPLLETTTVHNSNYSSVQSKSNNLQMKCTRIPLLYPSKLSMANASNHSLRLESLELSSYPLEVRHMIDYGIVISSYCYHPVYTERDVLLIDQKRSPDLGEVGVFLHKGNIYIRTFSKFFNYISLKTVNGIGPDIRISDFSNWIILGCVVGVHKL